MMKLTTKLADSNHINATELRQDIYNKLDAVIFTQKPLYIKRKGHLLKIQAEQTISKIKQLEPHDIIVGDADDLISTPNLSEWSQPQI